MKGPPVFVRDAGRRARVDADVLARSAVEQFDYIFTDSMTWTDNHGKRMRTWLPNEVGSIADPQEFMDTLVNGPSESSRRSRSTSTSTPPSCRT